MRVRCGVHDVHTVYAKYCFQSESIVLLSLLQEHCVLRFKLLISSKFFEKNKKYIEVQGIPILHAVKWGMYVQNTTNIDIV